ncbi:MAG: sporulation protein YunB [Clostridia bacterium]|nr:sporulation protein YunB [Clostridia bacterium]
MIECTDSYIYYKKHRKGRFKRCFCLFLVLLILISGFFYYKKVVCKQVVKICADYTHAFSTEAVNRAVLDSLSDGVKYTDVIEVEKNNDGEITLMTTNAVKVNALSREIVVQTADNLTKKLNAGIPIPILTFFGFSILSGYGGNVDLKTCSVTGVTCEFFSKFTSVGINQTLHSIYIKVISNVSIEIPLDNKSVRCETDVLISEAVLVGKVPSVYLDGKLFS